MRKDGLPRPGRLCFERPVAMSILRGSGGDGMPKARKDRLNALLLERIKSIVQHLYPEGHKEGRAWRVGSMDINLRTGMWGDWDGSTESMSRNLIDLWIHARGVNFVTAVR